MNIVNYHMIKLLLSARNVSYNIYFNKDRYNNKGLNYSLELADGNFRNYSNKSEKKSGAFLYKSERLEIIVQDILVL